MSPIATLIHISFPWNITFVIVSHSLDIPAGLSSIRPPHPNQYYPTPVSVLTTHPSLSSFSPLLSCSCAFSLSGTERGKERRGGDDLGGAEPVCQGSPAAHCGRDNNAHTHTHTTSEVSQSQYYFVMMHLHLLAQSCGSLKPVWSGWRYWSMFKLSDNEWCIHSKHSTSVMCAPVPVMCGETEFWCA